MKFWGKEKKKKPTENSYIENMNTKENITTQNTVYFAFKTLEKSIRRLFGILGRFCSIVNFKQKDNKILFKKNIYCTFSYLG